MVMDCCYLVLWFPLLECPQAVVVLLVLLALLLEHLQVGWVPAVPVVTLEVDLVEDLKNFLLILSESGLTTATALDVFLVLLPLPLPFTCVFCTDFALSFTAMGMHVDMCADFDLVLGLPNLDVDAVGLSNITHSAILLKFCCHFSNARK